MSPRATRGPKARPRRRADDTPRAPASATHKANPSPRHLIGRQGRPVRSVARDQGWRSCNSLLLFLCGAAAQVWFVRRLLSGAAARAWLVGRLLCGAAAKVNPVGWFLG